MILIHLEEIKKSILDTIKKIDEINWAICEIIFDFLPFVNKGSSESPAFFDSNLKPLDFFPNYEIEFEKNFYDFIVKYNQKQNYNQIIFKCKNHDFENATIELVFNKQIDDDFQNSLPKSKRGKIVPWYVSEKLQRDTL